MESGVMGGSPGERTSLSSRGERFGEGATAKDRTWRGMGGDGEGGGVNRSRNLSQPLPPAGVQPRDGRLNQPRPATPPPFGCTKLASTSMCAEIRARCLAILGGGFRPSILRPLPPPHRVRDRCRRLEKAGLQGAAGLDSPPPPLLPGGGGRCWLSERSGS